MATGSLCLLLALFCYFVTGLMENGDHVVTTVKYRKKRTSKSCWIVFRCTKYTTESYKEHTCEAGYRSTDDIGCPHAICDGAINPTGACNRYYANSHIVYPSGHTQRYGGGSCKAPEQCEDCNDGFYASPNSCLMCSSIRNCDFEQCTNSRDEVCSRCEGLVMPDIGFRAYAPTPNNKTCIQACSWRSDSTRCYPGTCSSEHADSCHCMENFSGKHCQIIDSNPTILLHELILRSSDVKFKSAPESPNPGSSQETSWTNINDSTSIQVNFSSAFKPNGTLPKPHAFIKGYKVGITAGSVSFKVMRAGRGVKSYTLRCKDVSELNPNSATFKCEEDIPVRDILSLPVQNEDIMEFTFSTTNGGHVIVEDKEAKANKTEYFIGKTVTSTFNLGFDFKNPHHCTTEAHATCSHNMLTVPKFSTTSPISVVWRGWLDNIAIDYCTLAVYELIARDPNNTKSKLEDHHIVQSHEKDMPQTTWNISLSTAGAYAVTLTAYDKAGNHKTARRILLYDGSSEVKAVDGRKLLITSAAHESEHVWQWTDHSVTIDWKLRYTNPLHDKNKWLKGVASIHDVESAYDDNDVSRGIDPIPNVQGIVEYQTAFLTDHSGGRTIMTTPPDHDFLSQTLNQHQTVAPVLVDGDTLRFWLRTFDFRRMYLEENRTVHIDTSPPVIDNLWLTRQDRLNVSVHNMEDFKNMTFEFMAYDIHSGLETVEWRLFDNFTGEELIHGLDRPTAQGDTETIEECEEKYGEYARGSNCYCTPGVGCFHRHYQVTPRVVLSNLTHGGVFHDKHRGVHDSDYYLEVTVMNRAKLYTKLDFKLTIDTSPPQAGVVHDGRVGQAEVDFQDSLQLDAHWDSFFDKESGVKFYQYKFDDRCLTASQFGLSLENYTVTETFSTHATWRAPAPGTYFITVVAYNSALEPSPPVCSDGVTVDKTPPLLSEVDVDNSRVMPGLVTTTDGSVWFIDTQRRRSLVVDADDSCRTTSTTMEESELQVFPYKQYHNGTQVTYTRSFCSDKLAFPSQFIRTLFLSKQHHLYVNWTGGDSESGIYDYEVGLMSDASGEAAPDIHPYTSTHHHHHYHNYHPALNTGEQFFIAVKATNKAGVSITKVIGPIIVHTQRPGFTGEISVRLNSDTLLADWAAGSFTDPGDDFLSYDVALRTNEDGSYIFPFTSLKSGKGCNSSGNSAPTCTVISLRNLPWDIHQSQTYYVSIRVTNIAGLSTVVTSPPYVHDVRLPSPGVVMEICPLEEREIFKLDEYSDSDYQMATDTLTARWYGFDDEVLNVTYRIGVGSDPGLADVVSLTSAGNRLEHTFNELTLSPSKHYYVTIEARSNAGITTLSSDGVYVIVDGLPVDNIMILDGLGCFKEDIFKWEPGHQESRSAANCSDDAVYQLSISSTSAHWNRSEDLANQYPDIHWSLQRKMPKSDDMWLTEKDFEFAGTSEHLLATGLSLLPGHTYRARVRFCASTVCTRPVHSDGVIILHNPPVGDKLSVAYTDTSTGSMMDVILSRYYDPDVPVRLEAYDAIDRYEWSLTYDSHDSRSFIKWTSVKTLTNRGQEVNIKIDLPKPLDFSKCRRLAVRGYNKVGLYTVVSADVKNCTAYDPIQVTPRIVIDALGTKLGEDVVYPVSLDLNERWTAPDVDYTPYMNMLSAVWPSLRHRNYTWAVVSGDKVDPTSHYQRENLMTVTDPCSLPDVLKCGQTEHGYVNIDMREQLLHGSRYYICVHAAAMTVEHEKWEEILPEVNSCSDGVTVDLTRPQGGRVFIGGSSGDRYQVSKTDMEVHWDGFIDVEESGQTPHPTGISHYEVSLGTIAGGRDLGHRRVGLVNHFTFHHLNLHDGNAVYATVKATDFVNRSSSVVSPGIIIDSTPPFTTGKLIRVSGRYITSPIFEACWGDVLVDNESGMKSYHVSLGSRPGYDDVISLPSTNDGCKEIDLGESAVDGHVVFVTVKGFNNAGLHTAVTSRPLMVDTSAPSIGYVYDGQISLMKDNAKDLDYATRVSDMGVHWEGFLDPHSPISHYLVRVGTCQGCEDVIAKHNVGARTALTLTNVVFAHGVKYYVEVTACNMAGLCSVGSSDGVILDVTPPVPGYVQDGTDDHDIQFQASRYFLGCKWRGFYDPESGIDHYEWRVGSTPGGDDILAANNVALNEMSFDVLTNERPLPVGDKLYSTVTAYNNAGQRTELVSNGFVVDDTPPEFVSSPRHVNDLTTSTTTFSRSTLKIVWQVKDEESFLERQYISISSHQLGEFDSSLTQVPGLLREYTFTQLDLHDGSVYKIKLTSCNMAGLCISDNTEEILVDSSPPNSGSLALRTDHAASLSRHQAGWMTWNQTSLSLAWLGFSDLHSGIGHYIVTVGSAELQYDLNKNSVPARIEYSRAGTDHEDEGLVQTFVISTEDLTSRDSVYVTVWAINGVGLKSPPIHHELKLVVGGDLELVRRCQQYNCQGSCVCNTQDGRCSASNGCSMTEDVITVIDNTGLHISTDSDEDVSCFDTFMAATWSPDESVKTIVKYYEVSLGFEDSDEPEGVFDGINERVWFDVGRNTSAVISLSIGKVLANGERYSFFVRAWFTEDSYSISKSDGIVVDTNRPQITKLRGISIKEYTEDRQGKDVDFQRSTHNVSVDWNNVFLPGQSGLLQYIVYISETPGGHSIHTSGDLTSTSYTAEGLSLEPNTVYYTSVRAYDKAGLVSWAYSDGVQVDVQPPVSGIVYDGHGLRDADYQDSPTTVSASWHGFSDVDSAITNYHWCVGAIDDSDDCSIVPWQDVGLRLSASKVIPTLEPGTRVWSKVYAEDGVGLRSPVVISDGVVIDTSPPQPQSLVYLGDNLIQNPSFEETVDSVPKTNCTTLQPEDWELENSSCVHIHNNKLISKEGDTYITLSGTIRQDVVNLMPGEKYMATLHVGYSTTVSQDDHIIEGFVAVGDEKHTFSLDPHRCKGVCSLKESDFILWNTVTFSINCSKETSTLTIGTSTRGMKMVIDHVSLQRVSCNELDRGSQSTGDFVVHSVFQELWSSVHALWHFSDDQSPIVEYKWAVGLTKGGIDIQDFQSVGADSEGRLTGLELIHGSSVYITVWAVNAAGLRTVSYSEPTVVDMTPPVFTRVSDGLGSDTNLIAPDVMSVNWVVADPESDVTYCDWAVGRVRGGDDVKGLERVPEGQSFDTANLADKPLPPYTRVYSTIRCFNQAGLASSSSSDGVVLVTGSEGSSLEGLRVLGGGSTVFSNRDTCHYDPHKIRLNWVDSGNPNHHSTIVGTEGGAFTYYTRVPRVLPYTYCELNTLHLTPLTDYNISIVPYDYWQQPGQSSVFQTQQRSTGPVLKENATVELMSVSKEKITLGWDDVFISPWPELAYEVDIGSVLGGADFVGRHVTRTTGMEVELESVHTDHVVVSVTAIDPCGYTAHVTQKIAFVKEP